MEAQKEKCAHPACSCPPEKGSKYCSQYCHDARETLELSCNCSHPACSLTSGKGTVAA
jgi:hypothetical protein